MNLVHLKRGVFLTGTSPSLFHMIDAAKIAYFQLGKDVEITSGAEGTHMPTSFHYIDGRALDFGVKYLSDAERVEVMDKLRELLGDDYDVVFEGNHFHVEFDPEQE